MILPELLAEISYRTFENCTNLLKIVLPEKLRKIGQFAFSGCSSLTEVVLPKELTEIGSGAFSGCVSLSKAELPEKLEKMGPFVFSGCKNLTEVALPAGLKELEKEAFDGCESLTEVVLPRGLTQIGTSAFAHCRSLEAITIPASLTTGLENIFGFTEDDIENAKRVGGDKLLCDNLDCLKKITVDQGNTAYSSDEQGLLYNAEKTKLLQVPLGLSGTCMISEHVTSIADAAFCGCTRITAVVIPASVTKVPDTAFLCCTALKRVILPETITEIGESAFAWCKQLTEISLPSGLKVLGKGAFQGCESLEVLTLPAGLTELPIHVLDDCTCLTRVNGILTLVESGCQIHKKNITTLLEKIWTVDSAPEELAYFYLTSSSKTMREPAEDKLLENSNQALTAMLTLLSQLPSKPAQWKRAAEYATMAKEEIDSALIEKLLKAAQKAKSTVAVKILKEL